MTTGKTQYLIHVSDDEPVETTATTDTPEETTTTTADSEESKNTVSVPNLVGMNFNEAMQKYGDSIELDVKDKEYSLYERDIIFEQSVPENETVPKGSKITVKVSLGVMKVQLQDMTGWDYETAKQTIMSLGLVPEPQKMYDSKIEAGRVIRTEPACPCELMPGATVKIIVSLGDNKDMTKVPDFIGKSWNDAQQLAIQNNLKIVKKEMNSTSPAGTVLKQNIEAKTEVSVGSTIELSVSCGDAQFSEVSILLDVPSTAVGTFYITMYNSGVPVSKSECFNAADTMGITQVIVTGTGKKEINALLTNEDTDKEAHIGTFMVDFDKKTYYIISADTVTAYEQVGALTTAPTNTSYTTSRTYAS